MDTLGLLCVWAWGLILHYKRDLGAPLPQVQKIDFLPLIPFIFGKSICKTAWNFRR